MGGGGFDYYDPADALCIGSVRRFDQRFQRRTDRDEYKKNLPSHRPRFDGSLRDWEDISRPRTPSANAMSIGRGLNSCRPNSTDLTRSERQWTRRLSACATRNCSPTRPFAFGEIAEKLGSCRPSRLLEPAPVVGQPAINPRQSGRLELAQWLTNPKNPLTSRVIVNRVWQHLFGQGLVQRSTTSASSATTPSHPDLLDYLATRFLHDGWSIKRLVRDRSC